MTPKQYQSTALYNHPFTAVSWREAASIATDLLAKEIDGKAELVSATQDGDHIACVATLTTEKEVWERGHKVTVPETETRRFVIKPA